MGLIKQTMLGHMLKRTKIIPFIYKVSKINLQKKQFLMKKRRSDKLK